MCGAQVNATGQHSQQSDLPDIQQNETDEPTP
jgi:hypothetical protein